MREGRRPRRWRTRLKRLLVRVRQKVPPGARLLLGLVLMGLGVFGFLPVIGFWMFPLGVAVAALDIVPIYRWIRARIAAGDGR